MTSLPESGAGVWCRSSVPEFGAGVRCRSSVPEFWDYLDYLCGRQAEQSRELNRHRQAIAIYDGR